MAVKQVKEKSKRNLYLYVFHYIKEHHSLPTHEFSKQKLNYYVTALKKASIIRRKGYSVWEIIGDFTNLNKYKKVNDVTSDHIPKKTRGHGFTFNILLRGIEGWSNRESYLTERNIPFKSIKQGQSIKLRGHTIWLCNNSIVMYFSPNLSFYAHTSYDASARALMECKETLRALEKELEVNLKYGKGWFINESKSHYADIQNVMSKYYHSRGVNSFEIKQFGKTWALIDNSFNLYELEAIAGGGKSKDDITKLQIFLNDIRDNPTTLTQVKEQFESEMKDTFRLMREQTKAIAELQKQNIMLTDIIQRKL